MDLTRYDKLRSAIRRTLSPDEAAAADRALEYAAEHTASQVRHDGSPMLDHAAEVARIGLEEIGLGGDSVVAAILHDVVRTASRQDEETFLRLTDEIRDRFGKEVLGMTVSLSHISDIRLKASREQAENFRELIVSYSEDPRVILIKLADRLEVMRRLEIFPREKWRKKSWESLNLYAQIAHKLGLYNIKSELEDIALRYLEPQDYQHIADKLAETESERRAFIARVLEPITQRLDQAGLRYHVKSRTKSIFSIWNKMRKQHVPFEGYMTSSPSVSSWTVRSKRRSSNAGRSIRSSRISTRPIPSGCATGSPSPNPTATNRSTPPSPPKRDGGSKSRSAPSGWTPWRSGASRPTGATKA